MNTASLSGIQSSAPVPRQEDGIDALLRDIRARRAEFRAQRHVSPDIVERFKTIGVYRSLLARTFGGDEHSPAEFCRLIERISEADGACGWVASFGVSATYLAALPLPTLRELYAGGPDIVFGGGIYPLQPARRVDGGFIVNGRWKFASGCMGAMMVSAGILVDNDQTGGLPRVAVLPAEKVRIEENWDVIGLEGTGSHDVVIEDAFVPEHWTFVRGSKATYSSPIGRYPAMALAAQVLAVVGLGVARDALRSVTEMSGTLASITGAPGMGQRAYVQLEIAKAEARLRSARSFFYEQTEAVWETALAGNAVSVEDAALLRLAASHAARVGADVSRAAFALAGTAAIYQDNVLARALSDSLVVAQHAFLAEGTLQSAGQVLLGQSPASGFP